MTLRAKLSDGTAELDIHEGFDEKLQTLVRRTCSTSPNKPDEGITCSVNRLRKC
jgi:hypothetical protein